MKKPKLIIITGMVATGKTAFAKKLGELVRIPVFCRDEFKELGFDVLGTKDRTWSMQLGALSYETLYLVTERVLMAGVSVIIESPFPPERVATKIQEIQKLVKFECYQIRLYADPEMLFDRFKNRISTGERHPGHVDNTIMNETKESMYMGDGKIGKIPLDCPFLDIDTTNFTKIDYNKIVKFIKLK